MRIVQEERKRGRTTDTRRSYARQQGESEQGPSLRAEAFEQCKRAVDDACDLVVSSLCREPLTEVREWLGAESEDPETPVRLAVVRAGFCEFNRLMATRRLHRLLGGRFLPRTLRPSRFQSAFLALEKAERQRWRLDHDGDESQETQHMVFIVDDVESASTKSLSELLLGVVSARRHRVSIVFIVGASWELPSSTVTVVAKEFSLPPFEAFGDAFFDRLLVKGDLGVILSRDIVRQWLDGLNSNVRAVSHFVRRVRFLLQIHFEATPGSFLAATTDDIDDFTIAANESDVRAVLESPEKLLFWRQLIRCLTGFADALVRVSPPRLLPGGSGPLEWRAWDVVAAFALPSEDSPAGLDRFLKEASDAALARILADWRDVARTSLRAFIASPDVFGHQAARLTVACLAELALVASLDQDDGPRSELRDRALDVFSDCRSLAHQLQGDLGGRATRLIAATDAAAVAKPFNGQLWSATIDALNTSSKDPRCLAFQIASDHLNLDVDEWYQAYQEGLLLAPDLDDDHDDDDVSENDRRSAHFVAALRDLAYTGIVREHGTNNKKGRFMVCGH